MLRQLDRVVRLVHREKIFTFRIERDPPLAFWTVEVAGQIYRSPLRVSGGETPAFFRALAEATLADSR